MQILPYQFEDDGNIPNSVFPLLVYKNAFTENDSLADAMEQRFARNNWTNPWRNGVFGYHHYHSTTHEVLGVYSGSAQLHLGGKKGQLVEVATGDVLIIPAGTGHKKISASDDFAVVGTYPDGKDYDILTGKEEERKRALENIAKVPVPEWDPVSGNEGGIKQFWK